MYQGMEVWGEFFLQAMLSMRAQKSLFNFLVLPVSENKQLIS
jgi:hypothetical protein